MGTQMRRRRCTGLEHSTTQVHMIELRWQPSSSLLTAVRTGITWLPFGGVIAQFSRTKPQSTSSIARSAIRSRVCAQNYAFCFQCQASRSPSCTLLHPVLIISPLLTNGCRARYHASAQQLKRRTLRWCLNRWTRLSATTSSTVT